MSPGQSQKSKAEEEIQPANDPFAAELGVPARPAEQETLSEPEREKMRRDVLSEIAETEKPMVKAVPLAVQPPPAVLLPEKSEELVIIENILAEDLDDIFFNKMDLAGQQKFKDEGEKLAVKLEGMLKEAKVKTGAIYRLIVGWLKLIPGVNKFFLKQEAKLKTDKLMKLR
jgi:hypothetical protein